MLANPRHAAYSHLRSTRLRYCPPKAVARWTHTSTLAQGHSQGGEWPRKGVMGRKRRRGANTALSLWLLFPRHKFSTSIFNTPILLVLRLFYNAAPFDWKAQTRVRSILDYSPNQFQRRTGAGAPKASLPSNSFSAPISTRNSPRLFGHYQKIPPKRWLHKLAESPSVFENYQVVSITWVKGLGSPLSHEYIQFVVEDKTSSLRSRLIADRHEDGDWIIEGWRWASGEGPSSYHKLPLPLASVIYDDPWSRPSMSSIAEMVANISSSRPGYNLSRHHCWWFSEAVFDAACTKFGGNVKEWKWARYRYSFIVRTSVIRREELVFEAERFKRQNVTEMNY